MHGHEADMSDEKDVICLVHTGDEVRNDAVFLVKSALGNNGKYSDSSRVRFMGASNSNGVVAHVVRCAAGSANI